MRRASCTTVATLALDLLIHVLDRLPDPADRKAWRLVCRAFLAADSLHRRDLRPLRRGAIPGLLRRYAPALELLDLSACAALDDRCLAASLAAAPPLPRLRRLDLSRACGVSWRGISAVASALARVEAVDLSHSWVVGDREVAALAAALPGLRELRLDKCLRVTDVGLARVAVGCPALQRLYIKWCLEITDIGIDLLAKKCRELRVLDVSYLKVSNKALQSISTLGKLEVLSMVGCSDIDDEGLCFLNNGCNSLQSIDVSRCDYVSSSGLISVIEGHKSLKKIKAGDCFPELAPFFLSQLSVVKNSLTVLLLDGFHVSASCLQMIGAYGQKLEKIGLSKCQGVSDDGISDLVSGCSGLKSIDLTCCRLLTDNALLAIAKSCKKLTSLLLESCSLITENGLNQIAACCPYLIEIDLTDSCTSDTALKCLAKCLELEKVKLGLCPNISDEGLTYLVLYCRNLKELDLYRTDIGDAGMAALATNSKKLKRLNLCYCARVTDLGLKHLSCLDGLKDLELRGLNHVTSAGIMALAIGCQGLVSLELKHCSSVDDVGFAALARHLGNLRQLTVSYCQITDDTLCKLLGALRCLQDAKLVNLPCVSNQGFELALRACCVRLKKLKLLAGRKQLLSTALLQILESRGCRIRWVDKPHLMDV